jgi:hypothetical protein
MIDALQDALAVVIAFVPRLLLAIVIGVVGILLARLISKGLSKLLERVGFDRAVERGGIKRALEKSSLDASDIVAKVVYYALVLFVLQFAFGVFGPNPISDLLAAIISFIPRIIVAIIIVVIVSAIAAAVKSIIQNTLGGKSYGKVLANAASVFILFLGITAALNQVGVADTVTTPLLYAVLAILAGVVIVGAGGGLIKPMQSRWERWLARAEQEVPAIKEQADAAPSVSEQTEALVTKPKRTPRRATAATPTKTMSSAEPTSPTDTTTPPLA